MSKVTWGGEVETAAVRSVEAAWTCFVYVNVQMDWTRQLGKLRPEERELIVLILLRILQLKQNPFHNLI